MKQQILFLLYLAIFFPFTVAGQDKPLKIIEPTLGLAPPTLDESELKKELQKINNIREAYGDEHLSKKQKEILDWDYEDRQDLWDVGQIGDGWYNCAWVDTIFATSELKPFNGIAYKASNVHDFSLRTAWVEGVEGYGIGESITCRFPQENPPVTTVMIYNGYMKSDKTWRENSRVKQLKLYINGKPYALLNLKDTKRDQHFYIGKHHGGKSNLYLKFEITDVYKGEKYDDVAISEINFDGTDCLCFAKGTMVSTPNGEKPIEQLKAGDKVLSLNTQTNKIEEATIWDLANKNHYLYELDFDDVKIKATADHPFYFEGNFYSIVENSTYGVESKLLTIGQTIHYLIDGQLRTIVLKKVNKLDKYEKTYTITKLDKNGLFFANGLCVATEEIY